MLSLADRIKHLRLARQCQSGCDSEIAFVAQKLTTANEPGNLIGIGRLTRLENQKHGEIAVLVSDSFQRMGIGSALVSRLLTFARGRLTVVKAFVLGSNPAVQKLLEGHGFAFVFGPERGILEGVLSLAALAIPTDQ